MTGPKLSGCDVTAYIVNLTTLFKFCLFIGVSFVLCYFVLRQELAG